MKFLLAIILAVGAWPLLAQTPEWIWHSDTNETTVYFRKTFRTPPLLWNSRLTVSADDHAEVFLNGVSVARCTDFRRPSRSEVTVRLNQGENVIAVKAQVNEGARGVLVHLNLAGEVNLVSDSTWLTSTREEEGWSRLTFNAADWQNARSLGQHGVDPWGDVLFRPAATSPESITVRDGFRVELLRSAEPNEGSWICMTFDPKGRIIVSPQGENRPLLRMTLDKDSVTNVEKIEAPISYAMGLLHAFDSLYVNGIGPSGAGLYRLIDANKNDRYETNELHFLKGFKGGSEHGYHALAVGPDKKIYVLNGNGTKLPQGISPKSPYRNYAEDALTGARGDDLPGTKAPNCHVLRTDPDGKEWQLFAGGMRNAFDMDFNSDGELFTFDSDNEWDWGVPWYRPTRIVHLVSGGDAGWRDGTRMWSEYYADAVRTVANVGIGSPTGVKFARGGHFSGIYAHALFVQDWSYGRILAIHLEENRAGYRASVETFIEGAPLNLTALTFGPDGAMFFITGGRGTQSGLYRVTHLDPRDSEERVKNVTDAHSRNLRKRIEQLHGNAGEADLAFVWDLLGSPDRSIQFAARVALESIPVSDWQERALVEDNSHRALPSLLALARVGRPEDQSKLFQRLEHFSFGRMRDEARFLAKLRVIQVSVARHGPSAARSSAQLRIELNGVLSASLMQGNPSTYRPSEAVKHELARILLLIDPAHAIPKTIQLMERSDSREDQLFYVELLRNVSEGWTLSDREKFFSWFLPGNRMPNSGTLNKYFADVKRSPVDGASYDSYLRDLRRQAIATLSRQERKHLEPLLALPIIQAQLVPAHPRRFIRAWKMEDFLPELTSSRKPDLARGRQAFVDAQCLTCHRFGNDGGASAPELTGAGSKYSERDLLESIIEPSKVVSDQYQNHTVFLKDGDVLIGKVISDSESEVVVETDRVGGTKEKVPRSKVQQIKPASLSPMPEGLVNVLTKEEILDLLAYVRSGAGANPVAKLNPQ